MESRIKYTHPTINDTIVLKNIKKHISFVYIILTLFDLAALARAIAFVVELALMCECNGHIVTGVIVVISTILQCNVNSIQGVSEYFFTQESSLHTFLNTQY